MEPRRRAFVGLGSNLGDRHAFLRAAVEGLRQGGDVVAVSPLYETEPVGGPPGQGAYLNAVVELSTGDTPRALLGRCQALEEAAGRVRAERWGPRTLDADLLYVEGCEVDEPDLTVPHPRLWERRFVLAPLADLAPDLVPPSRLEAAGGAVTRGVRFGRHSRIVCRRTAPVRGWNAEGGQMYTIRIIGPGRAGTSLGTALAARGWSLAGYLGRDDDVSGAARGVDVLVVATPDDTVAEVAALVEPVPSTTVVHLSGSLGLDALAPHPRRGGLHPLVPLPNVEVGAARLVSGVTFAVAGAPEAGDMARSLGGRVVEVADADRAAYHAAACIAANHVVALLGQVERVAASVGLSLESFLPLTRAALDDVDRLGPGAALTGPARRGDWATLSRHLDVLAADERPGYQAGAALATKLAGATVPVAV